MGLNCLCQSTSMWIFFFNNYVLHYAWLVESSHAELWYRGLTVKLYAKFWLHGGSAPLTSSLFKGQLYIKTSALLYASNKQNLNFKKPPFKMATQTTKYLGKNKNTWDLNGKNYKTHIIFNYKKIYLCLWIEASIVSVFLHLFINCVIPIKIAGEREFTLSDFKTYCIALMVKTWWYLSQI